MTDQLDLWTGPFVRNEDPPTSHEAAETVVEREGGMGQIRRGKNRHVLMQIFRDAGSSGVTQEQAGQIALTTRGVGRGTVSGSDSGRRRCDDLENMGIIRPVLDTVTTFFPEKKTTPWALTDLGRELLARLDAGEKVVRTPWLR